MKWKTVAIVGAVLFLAGFLLGFIPEYQRASKFAKQLQGARLEGTLTEIRESASLSYIDASKMNYGAAAEDSERMFGLAGKVARDTKDDGLRSSLNGLSTFRDTVKGGTERCRREGTGAAISDCAKDTKGIEALTASLPVSR